jgi:hypothetical protein
VHKPSKLAVQLHVAVHVNDHDHDHDHVHVDVITDFRGAALRVSAKLLLLGANGPK